MTVPKTEGMLTAYRVLDLTDEKGLLCGKLMADLGADVVKIEPPDGDPARRIGPFYHDERDPEKSLFWWAYNAGKRGITLDVATADGQAMFKRLVEKADFVIESSAPGYMDSLGLDYAALEGINPGVIMVSITSFGQAGPHKDYKAPDIVALARGGVMCLWGDPDRPPVRIGHHSQAYLLAGASAAGAAMMALHHRSLTGEGQQLDVSVHECVVRAAYQAMTVWDMMKINARRGGLRADVTVRLRQIWPCKDGYVMWLYTGGDAGRRWNPPIVEWMDGEGMADDVLRGFDWDTFFYDAVTQETVDRLEKPTAEFFMSRTKAELMAGAVRHRVMLFPVATSQDALESAQLVDRGFWTEVAHPELGAAITYPGAFAVASECSPSVSGRAPLVGEHNQSVYGNELGLSGEEIAALRQNDVI